MIRIHQIVVVHRQRSIEAYRENITKSSSIKIFNRITNFFASESRNIYSPLTRNPLPCLSATPNSSYNRNHTRFFHSSSFHPMKYQIKILSTFSDDSRPSILVVFDNQHYLFNCGEGTQRICGEQGQSIIKIRNVFFNDSSWEYSGGIPGFLLTLNDALDGIKEPITLYGTNTLSKMKDFVKTYSNLNHIHFSDLEDGSSDGSICFQDENLTVHKVMTKISDSDFSSRLKEKEICDEKVEKKRRMMDDYPVAQYVCYGPQVRGTFFPKKAMELGVAKGPLFGKLAQGECIVLDDGTIISPEQVMGDDKPSTIWMILRYPTKQHLLNIIENSFLSKYWKNSAEYPSYVFHMPGPEVPKDLCHRFIAYFPESTKHFIFDEEKNNPITFRSLLGPYKEFHRIHARTYPNYWTNGSINYDLGSKNIFFSQPKTVIQVEPEKKLDIPQKKSLLASDNSVKSPLNQQTLNNVKTQTSQDLVIIPLGTGSACPSKYRNVSSTMVMMPSGYSYLLDTGEGTLGQITRFLGRKRSDAVLSKLSLIFISHIHGDHHFGLMSIIKKWNLITTGSEEKLYLVCDKTIWRTFLTCSTESIPKERIVWMDPYCLLLNPHLMDDLKTNSLNKNIDLKQIEPVPVTHCPDSFGLVMHHHSHGKVVFSGDCRPSNELIKSGQDCNVLIHEATFDNEKIKEAIQRKHCTTDEAIQVAKRMNARNVLLTHFSQRYPKHKSAEWNADVENDTSQSKRKMNLVCAIDQMMVHLQDFPELNSLSSQFERIAK